MIEKVKKFISSNNLFSKDNNLLLAISGGADSVCLFFVLKALGYNFQLAHCNFNLRGKESDKDQSFVKLLASRYGVIAHFKSFETKKYADSEKISIQMAARQLRYKWFEELLKDYDCDYVITAHNKDDNVETFFINLIRGTGINGLCGIRIKNKHVVRPLLDINRKEIEEYLEKNNVPFRFDKSNLDIKYLRNQVRHEVLPLFKNINLDIHKIIAKEISYLNGVNEIFKKQIEIYKSKLIRKDEYSYRITIAQLIELDNLEVILFEMLRPFGFFQINNIIKAMSSQSGKQFFSSSHQLIIDRKEIIITLLMHNHDQLEIFHDTIEINTPLCMRFMISSKKSFSKDVSVESFDFERLAFPLILRKWKVGDKFQPLGMNHFKKLSDFFIDEKYSLVEKQNQWILCSKDDIVWIVGKRIDDRYKIDTHTKKVYIAKLFKQN